MNGHVSWDNLFATATGTSAGHCQAAKSGQVGWCGSSWHVHYPRKSSRDAWREDIRWLTKIKEWTGFNQMGDLLKGAQNSPHWRTFTIDAASHHVDPSYYYIVKRENTTKPLTLHSEHKRKDVCLLFWPELSGCHGVISAWWTVRSRHRYWHFDQRVSELFF